MDNKEPNIIGIFTYKLPYDLANLMYREFEDKFREVKYFIEHLSYYKRYKKDIRTIEILLAMSIFHKRVITNLDGAIQFRRTITSYSQAEVVKIGSYELDNTETNQLLSVIIGFRKLKLKYGIEDDLFNYDDTKGFFRKIRDLKKSFNKSKK